MYISLFHEVLGKYERVSNFLKVMNDNGYVTPTRCVQALASVQTDSDSKVIEKLYKEGLITVIIPHPVTMPRRFLLKSYVTRYHLPQEI